MIVQKSSRPIAITGYFMGIRFYDADAVPTGKVEYHKAFYSSE